MLGNCLPAAVLLIACQALAADPPSEARVTRVIKDVKLLPSGSEATAAAVDDKVLEDTAVRTGEDSRSELTFVDLTITRLGANTTFTFNKAGRQVQLNTGTILLYLPKGSDGVKMTTAGVSAGITGTTVVLRYSKTGHSQLTVLEGTAKASLIKYPRETTNVHGGEMIDVKRGATKMPRPVKIDLRKVMESPLITEFDPLPSQSLILGGMNNPPVKTSQPSGTAPPQQQPQQPPPPSYCWCCINGTVVQITEADCEERGGQCYGSRDEAIRNCSGGAPPPPRPSWCWCCINGKVVKTTIAECRDRDGQCYGSREEAVARCSGGGPTSPAKGWCCVDGKVVQTVEADCQERGGQWYASKEEALRKCRKANDQSCWCCINGKIVQTTVSDCQEKDGQCFGSKKEALQKCSGAGPTSAKGWCCIEGKLVQATEAECQQRGGQYYGSRKEAVKRCAGGSGDGPNPKPQGEKCWCCVEGKVIQTTEADCRQREGQCYGSRKEALKRCAGDSGGRPTPTPPHKKGGGNVPGNTGVVGPHRGGNVPKNTGVVGPHGDANGPKNTGVVGPKKQSKYPKGKPTPTPKPGKR